MAKLEIGILPHIQNQRKALSAQFFELNPKNVFGEGVNCRRASWMSIFSVPRVTPSQELHIFARHSHFSGGTCS